MSKSSSDAAKNPMKKPCDDLSEAMRQLSVTSNETSPSLSDMPIDIVALITEKLDYKQQLKLRKVSKSLRALIDKQKPACKSIKLEFWTHEVITSFDNHSVMYIEYEDVDDANTLITVKGKDFKKVAFDDLASTFKNPKLQLERLMISDYLKEEESKKYYNEIQRVLRSLNHQVSVKEIGISVRSSSWLLSILPHLKPGVLEKIWLNVLENEADWSGDSMNKVALLEQWKQAKEFGPCWPFETFPMEYATHFKRFRIFQPVIDINMFDRIKDFLSKLDNFEYCRITHWYNIDDVQRTIGTPVQPNIIHYSITDSDSCLEFSFVPGVITIVKKICRFH